MHPCAVACIVYTSVLLMAIAQPVYGADYTQRWQTTWNIEYADYKETTPQQDPFVTTRTVFVGVQQKKSIPITSQLKNETELNAAIGAGHYHGSKLYATDGEDQSYGTLKKTNYQLKAKVINTLAYDIPLGQSNFTLTPEAGLGVEFKNRFHPSYHTWNLFYVAGIKGTYQPENTTDSISIGTRYEESLYKRYRLHSVEPNGHVVRRRHKVDGREWRTYAEYSHKKNTFGLHYTKGSTDAGKSTQEPGSNYIYYEPSSYSHYFGVYYRRNN